MHNRPVPAHMQAYTRFAAFAMIVSASVVPAAHSIEPERASSAPYIRVVDDETAQTVRLEVAARRFEHPADERPVIRMAGAVHIGDAVFYESLQSLMDAQDVVLFESVKPSGSGELPPNATDEDKAKYTKRRLKLLSMLIEREAQRSGALPASIEAAERSADDRFARIMSAARKDAWGGAIRYEVSDDGERFTLTSDGADGVPGGEELDADLMHEARRPSPGERAESSGGIQKQLASSLGLVFQPEAMNEGGPNWRNSDMSIDQVQERMEAHGADASPLFNMLSGESFTARFASVLLRLISASEQSRSMTKLAMVEMLGSADQLLAAGGGIGMPGGEGFLKVIIEERNEVVIADLVRIIENEPDVRTIGILYGAGHLAHLESRLADLGYLPVEDRWFPAITIDLAASGMSAQQAAAMRQMMRTSIERQLKAAQRRR
ncbi:MAG: type II secretion system protein GspG [Phycisphaeraceae bacterium]|nr:type II secretion system protein GspG [Phycisphaeraceae bacterium]